MRNHEASMFASGFVFLEGLRWQDGRLWMSDMWGCACYNLELDGRRTKICSVPQRPSGLGFLPDGTGRAYVGNFGYDLFGGASAAPANIAMVSPDGTIAVAADNLTFPNGMVTIDGGRTLVVAETFANRLTAY